MTQWNEVYVEHYSAGAINASASEYFGGIQATENATQHRQRYGSANSLFITSIADEEFDLILDGVVTTGKLFTKGTFTIKPEEGIFFNTIQLSNTSGTNSSADEIKLRFARAEVVIP